jgi:hypothetical protein
MTERTKSPYFPLGVEWLIESVVRFVRGAKIVMELGSELQIEGILRVKDGGQLIIESGADVLGAGLQASLSEISVVEQHIRAAPAAVSATYVHAAANLGASAQDVASAITNPDVPRTVTAKGNVSGVAGDVVITGKNVEDDAITDTIALNGASEVEGVKAFKTVSNIHLPAQVHTPVSQAETATAVGTITGSGDATVIVTAAGMTGTPKTLSVAVLENDLPADWAAKVRTALGLDAAVIALFTVGGSGAEISLTRTIPAANDATLNISLDNGTCTGITTAGTSADTTAGVQYDTVSVGIAKKFGLNHIVYNAALLLVKLFDGSTDAGTLAVDDDEVEKNLYSLAGTPNGAKLLDLYYLSES